MGSLTNAEDLATSMLFATMVSSGWDHVRWTGPTTHSGKHAHQENYVWTLLHRHIILPDKYRGPGTWTPDGTHTFKTSDEWSLVPGGMDEACLDKFYLDLYLDTLVFPVYQQLKTFNLFTFFSLFNFPCLGWNIPSLNCRFFTKKL